MTANEVRALVERNRRRNGRPDQLVAYALAAIVGALVALYWSGSL